MQDRPFSIVIAGSGTAGLLASLILRRAFPDLPITIVSSSKIGIIGVGEGSTEHWRSFMELCDIPLERMIVDTAATHKYGIRFEDWSTHTPDYFHSISGSDDIFAFGVHATYVGFFEQEKLLTNQTSSIGLIRNKISRQNLHNSTNQYHFDTFKLNEFLTSLAFNRRIRFVDAEISTVKTNSDTGDIESLVLDDGTEIPGDFFFDATGFNRVLMNSIGSADWESYSKYLLCDSAIAFPTESDPSGQIRGYTRAMAMDSGWMWEIPTQERRGNGYVFSSQFCDEEQAVHQASKKSGYAIEKNRHFKFDAGYLKNCWVKNCCAIGLASSFVEPLEATSIGSTIQQIKQIVPYVAAYQPGNTASQKHFNKSFSTLMRNILTMIRLHYYSDRVDTPFWRAMADMPINPELEELLELWKERPPTRYDIPNNNGEMFMSPHLAHVAQGQGVITTTPCSLTINRMGLRERISSEIDKLRQARNNHELVDHAAALRETARLDQEWNSR